MSSPVRSPDTGRKDVGLMSLLCEEPPPGPPAGRQDLVSHTRRVCTGTARRLLAAAGYPPQLQISPVRQAEGCSAPRPHAGPSLQLSGHRTPARPVRPQGKPSERSTLHHGATPARPELCVLVQLSHALAGCQEGPCEGWSSRGSLRPGCCGGWGHVEERVEPTCLAHPDHLIRCLWKSSISAPTSGHPFPLRPSFPLPLPLHCRGGRPGPHSLCALP
uniref:Uncharacterized protein n=1 Tax=Pipistrellus kuhlii TaxID=59472 RepID=A0A7J7RA78_PIPKU|nr:hypothetical protein mPipKuh1_010698 [Pipistrellus kuhlii]